MEFAFILAAFFVLVFVVFIAIAFFYPEWVGIQGKVAKQYESDHHGETTAPDTKPKD